MMVYIVWSGGGWGKVLEGVFATIEGAREFIGEQYAEDEHADVYEWHYTEEEVVG